MKFIMHLHLVLRLMMLAIISAVSFVCSDCMRRDN
jgi:hypothetical protein